MKVQVPILNEKGHGQVAFENIRPTGDGEPQIEVTLHMPGKEAVSARLPQRLFFQMTRAVRVRYAR